jgi:hypothetical protein
VVHVATVEGEVADGDVARQKALIVQLDLRRLEDQEVGAGNGGGFELLRQQRRSEAV